MLKKHVIIAGNIASGKTTLTRLLAGRLNWDSVYEPVSENEYLELFYKNMDEWAFRCQMSFLKGRWEQLRVIERWHNSFIQDRGIYEDAEIFARNLYERKHISDLDYRLYRGFYEGIKSSTKPPDLIIYLEANVELLLHRVKLRGRDYEQDITLDYIRNLNVFYSRWVNEFDLCPLVKVNVADNDFIDNPNDVEDLVNIMRPMLNGLKYAPQERIEEISLLNN